MDGPGPAGLGEERRQRYQSIPDSTDRRDSQENCHAASALTETETKRLIVIEKDETAIVYCLVY